MYHIYVLESLKNNKRYTGVTSKAPEERLEEHNSGSNAFTRQNSPFKLVYSESHKDKTFTIKRERFLKSGNGRAFLDRKLKT